MSALFFRNFNKTLLTTFIIYFNVYSWVDLWFTAPKLILCDYKVWNTFRGATLHICLALVKTLLIHSWAEALCVAAEWNSYEILKYFNIFIEIPAVKVLWCTSTWSYPLGNSYSLSSGAKKPLFLAVVVVHIAPCNYVRCCLCCPHQELKYPVPNSCCCSLFSSQTMPKSIIRVQQLLQQHKNLCAPQLSCVI